MRYLQLISLLMPLLQRGLEVWETWNKEHNKEDKDEASKKKLV
jgi:hypothetical protein